MITKQELLTILSLRGKGLSFAQIGSRLDIPANTVKSICRRESDRKKRCRNCRNAITQNREGRPRAFCCDRCRVIWWKKNPDKVNRKAYYRLTCKGCGRCFESYGHKERLYCTHKCYIIDRFGAP